MDSNEKPVLSEKIFETNFRLVGGVGKMECVLGLGTLFYGVLFDTFSLLSSTRRLINFSCLIYDSKIED